MSTTFSPPVEPSVGGVRQSVTPALVETKLGDGYSQRARAGLNHIVRKVALRWDALERTDADTIVAFFEQQGGDLWFYYVLPPGSTSRKWVARSWDRDDDTPLTASVSAELVEVFDL